LIYKLAIVYIYPTRLWSDNNLLQLINVLNNSGILLWCVCDDSLCDWWYIKYAYRI